MKRLSSALFAALFFVLLVVPAFAASDNGITWEAQPIPVIDNPTNSLVVSYGLPVYSNGETILYLSTSYSSSNIFCWAEYGNPTEINGYRIVLDHNNATSYDLQILVRYCLYDSTSGIVLSSGYIQLANGIDYDRFSWWHFSVDGVSSLRSDCLVPIYQNASSAVPDLRSYSDSVTPPIVDPVEPTSASFTIPIGYAAFLKASGTLTMRCTFPSNSALFSGTSGWWGETHQTIGSSSSLPDASFQFPVSDALQIHWIRDSVLNPLGILGTTKHAYSEHAAFSPWTVIYNPVYKNVSIGSNANDPDSFNGPITVSGTIGEFRLYPLSSSLSSSGIVGDGSSDDFIDVTIDPETGEPVYTDPDGIVVAPPSAGGNTLLPEAASNTSLVQRIVGILNDLVQRIEGIFSVAYQAISSLVGLSGPFVSKLVALYSWLPAPVLSALTSAMILAITIGVLKVFL